MEICQLNAAQIMQTNIVSVNPDQSLLEVKHIYEKKQFHHHIPVVENNVPVGIISLSDFLFAIKTNSLDDGEKIYHEKKVKEIMSAHPVCLEPESTLPQILAILSKGDIHAIIITENKILKGIITSTDIIRLLETKCRHHDTNQPAW